MFVEKIKEAQELLANNSELEKVQIRFSIPDTRRYGYVQKNYELEVSRDRYYKEQFNYSLYENGLFGSFMGSVTPMKNGKGMVVKRFWLGKVMTQTMHYEFLEFEKMVQIEEMKENPEPVKETEELPF